jgi:hypothetical protein
MWLNFIIAGIAAAAVSWLAFRSRVPRRARLPLAAIAAAAVAGIAFYVFRGPQTLGDEAWWQKTPGFEITLFAVMLLGMVVRYITKAIEDRRQTVAEWKKAGGEGKRPGLELDKWEFAYPLLISAITFGALLSQIKAEQPAIENLLLAFQTGFFWQTLLAAKTRVP